MRFFVLLFISLIATLPGRAQERVRNVRVRVVDSSQLEIRYDIINARPGDSIYVNIRSRLRGALRILPEFVRGDVGKRITAGPDRRIIWDALANGYSLNEEIRATVLVRTGLPSALPKPAEPAVAQQSNPAVAEPLTQTKPSKRARPREEPPIAQPSKRSEPATDRTDVTLPNASVPVTQQPERRNEPAPPPVETGPTTKPDAAQPDAAQPDAAQPDVIRSRRTRYAGPAWALLSVVAPGMGNIFVQQPKPKIGIRPLITVGCYGLVVYGLLERQKAQDTYAVYERQKNVTAGEPYYQTANDHHHRYYLATRGAIAVAAADAILTFFKGLRNNRLPGESRRFQSTSLRPGLQAGQPTAVIRYSF